MVATSIAFPILLQCLLALVILIRYSQGTFYQRCRSAVVAHYDGNEAVRGNVTGAFEPHPSSTSSSTSTTVGGALLRDLQENSVCTLCEDYDGHSEDFFDGTDDVFGLYDDDGGEFGSSIDDDDDDNDNERALHVVFMVGSSPCLERVLILASGLLSMKVHVTLVIDNKSNLPAEAVFNAFMQHIPCTKEATTSTSTTSSNGVAVGSEGSNRRRNSRSRRRRSPPSNISALLRRLRFILVTTKNRCEEDLACHVSNAPTVLEALLENERMIVSADVAVVDGVFVAGMIMAEAHKIPALYLMETPTVFTSFLSLVDSAVVGTSVTQWWQSAVALLKHRWRSLDFPFAALNRIRTHAFGLPRIRELSDLWHAGLILLPYASNYATRWTHHRSDPLLIINGTYLPPCIPCDYPLHQQRKSSLQEARGTVPFVIVSVSIPANEVGRNAMRNVVRAVTLARSSLVDCNSTNGLKKPQRQRYRELVEPQRSCWNFTNQLEIVVLGQPDLLFPEFVHVTTTSFLDALAVYAPAVAIVASCDESNSVWKYALGPPVICVDRRTEGNVYYESPSFHDARGQSSGAWSDRRSEVASAIDVEDLAIRILRAVTLPRPLPAAPEERLAHPSNVFSGWVGGTASNDALVQFVRVAQLLAAHKAEKSGDWSDGRDMKRSMVRLLFRSSSPSTQPFAPSSSMVQVLALLVLALSAFYLLLVHVNQLGTWVGDLLHLLPVQRRTHRYPRPTHMNGSSTGTPSSAIRSVLAMASENLQVRFQELERVWTIWSKWGADVWAQMQDAESPGGVPPTGGPELCATASRSTEDQEATSAPRSSAPSKRRFIKSKRH